ncbi:MAG: beta-ketoacyl-[acyl-carrier-protein] synthase II [Spirochaetes bacterium GWD1_61_31]|nr:MAG: beta-ketoacyl-[acyl-carrier-protein] synthase II [Spirochaetes bacterium GWB1_60_80]OHD32740.1 MAG: beta-ketoacyl-[acyl-carrier-protein] synthase II [Spirochaetes bacterium GWC1_61_12]OHD40606.1 MAG: beta-ketoacyl-[acyl-carrier-protein] synthase II [Spirochaetes bacterium GWD1_61_31]OHD43878.1 MAG: beta-ketoacyl-[acyl-carrier-protein] synthase II [Spirochaetes bacterium GWE1_60_18]OHD59749.1 MAG: beta-ketoacyl-[acyl-carrier-protein] synthase II [Spirochaetes bacterium GWF1_60_12]HAP435
MRIVVTGIGVISSIGCTAPLFWDNLVAGHSGAAAIGAFDAAGFASRIACEARDFVPEDWLDRKRVRSMARFSQFASSAALQAVKDSGLDLAAGDPSRLGCVIGAAAGDYQLLESQHSTLLAKGPGHGNPLAVPKIIPNMAASNVAIDVGAQGPSIAVLSACASGAHSIGAAMDMLSLGHADIMLAGGTESTITPLVVDSYACMRVLSSRNDQPQQASRPFDRDRDGFVIGEGAAVLVLENYESAKRRGARIYAELLGYGSTCDAFSIAIPEPEGKLAAQAMSVALTRSGLNPADIGYINAHGTSTQANDKTETLAIKRVFGVNTTPPPPISSNKSMIGHTLGAAGAIEAAATILAIHHGILPPTINLDHPDPDCNLDYIPHYARKVPIKAAISNSFGFGGHNCVLCFGKI